LKFLGEEIKTYLEKEKANLRNSYLQAEIILSQERQIGELTGMVGSYIQDLVGLSYSNTVEYYTEFNQEQTEDLNKLRSLLDDENKVETYMEEILEGVKKQNVTLTSASAELDLHDSLKSLLEAQAETLESMKPTLSYFVNNNRNLRYQEIDGSLVAISACQCIPQMEDSKATVSGVQFTCPSEMVLAGTGEITGISPCLDGLCEDTIRNITCMDKWRVWSPWEPCTDNIFYDHPYEKRTRGLPGYQDIQIRSDYEQTPIMFSYVP